MAVFEAYEDGVIWTNGKVGAYLEDPESLWRAFRYFDNGSLDIGSALFKTASTAFDFAVYNYT